MPLSAQRMAPIIHAAARGDQQAWETLVTRFTPALRRVAKGYHLPAHDVDDVVQSCWLALFESLPSLREPEAVGGWLITAARRSALRMRQRDVREVLTDEPIPAHRTAPDSLEEAILRAERAAVLRQAVRRLPGRQRQVVEQLLTAPDRSYLELSRGIGMPVGSIGPTRERGLSRLRHDEWLAGVVA